MLVALLNNYLRNQVCKIANNKMYKYNFQWRRFVISNLLINNCPNYLYEIGVLLDLPSSCLRIVEIRCGPRFVSPRSTNSAPTNSHKALFKIQSGLFITLYSKFTLNFVVQNLHPYHVRAKRAAWDVTSILWISINTGDYVKAGDLKAVDTIGNYSK